MKQQRRGRRIAMTPQEFDEFLSTERTCRVATVGRDGPHATPLWFVWDGTCLWLYSIVSSQRWTDLQRDPRLGAIEPVFARKYMGGDAMFHDGRHAWLRVKPAKIVSWDFRKI